MSLLLTRNIDQYGIDLCRRLCRGVSVHHLHPPFLEPFTDEIAVKTITLDNQYALHGRTR